MNKYRVAGPDLLSDGHIGGDGDSLYGAGQFGPVLARAGRVAAGDGRRRLDIHAVDVAILAGGRDFAAISNSSGGLGASAQPCSIAANARKAQKVAAGGACDASHPGLSHLLSGEASFADAIFRDDVSRLHIVQAGGLVDACSRPEPDP